MFRLHRGGRRPSREPGTWRGKKSLTFEVNTALRFHSTHQASVPAIGGRMFFKSLTYLGPGRKPLETILVTLSRDRLAFGFRGLSYASPGTRCSSELDLLVGGRDRWTG